MKHLSRQLLLVFAGLLAVAAQAQDFRVGFVNTDRIFREANTAKSAQAKLASHLALSDANQLQYFKEQGLFPVTNSALALLGSDPYVSAWTQGSRFAERDEVSQWTTSADPVGIVGEEVQGALLGQKTPQAAIESMGKRLEVKMAELSKT